MEIALRVVQFWSEIKLVITNRTTASRSCDFVITRLISDQIALHSVQLPLFINRAYRNGYTSNKSDFKEIILNRDKKLWLKITNDHTNAQHSLLPNKLIRPLRQRGHDFELPIVKTERFKNVFINRCLFNFI